MSASFKRDDLGSVSIDLNAAGKVSGSGTTATPSKGRRRLRAALTLKTAKEFTLFWVTVGSGLAAVAGFVVSVYQINEKDDVQLRLADANALVEQQASTIKARDLTVADKTQTITDLTSQVSDLKTQAGVLQESNAALKKKLDGQAGTAALSTEPAPYAEGNAGISMFSGADLDNPDGFSPYGGDRVSELGLTNDLKQLIVGNGVKVAVLGATEANLDSCLGATNYSSDWLPLESTPPGTWMCVQTSGDRIASVRVQNYSALDVSVGVITWERN